VARNPIILAAGGIPSGIALGALAMFLFDPRAGRARRARVRDKWARARHLSGNAAVSVRRDMSNRAHGLAHELRARMHVERVADDVLVERVRAKIGRLVSHPLPLTIDARDGAIRLRGPILAVEVPALLARVRLVRGVRSVDNQLEVYDDPGRVPALQGAGRRRRLIIGEWSLGTRILAIFAGGALAARGLRDRNLLGVVESALGLAIGLRGLTGQRLARWFGRTFLPEADHPAPSQRIPVETREGVENRSDTLRH